MDNEVVIHVKVDDDGVDKSTRSIKEKMGKSGDESAKEFQKRIKNASPGIASDLVSTFASGFSKLPPMLPVLLAGTAPLLGATIAGAVVGGAAGIGVIGGVLLAAKDPRVKLAGTQLGQNLMSSLQEDAKPFVAPVLAGIAQIQGGFNALRPTIKNIFANTAQYVEPLTRGLIGGVQGIVRGIDAAASKAGPVIAAFSNLFAHTGNAVGDFFEKMAGQADNGARAIKQLDGFITETIGIVGDLIVVLSTLYGWYDRVNSGLSNLTKGFSLFDALNPVSPLLKLIDGLDGTTTAQEQAKEAAAKYAAEQQNAATMTLSAGEAAGKAGIQMSTYGDSMADAATKGQGYFGSQTAVAKAIRNAEQALKDNGKTLSLNSEKGLKNREALQAVAGQLTSNYAAYVKLNGEGTAASKVAEANRNSFIRVARQFGLSKKAAEDLATQMGLIPSKKKTDFLANTHDAAGRIAALKAQIAALKGKTIRITTVVARVNAGGDEAQHGGARASGGIVGAASGGMRGGMTWVGEYGPELLDLPPGTRVNSHPDSMRVVTDYGQPSDGRPLLVQLMLDGRVLAERMVDPTRTFVRENFGGSVQAAYGRG